MSPELTPQEFAAFWNEMNREFMPYKVSPEDLAKQGQRYFSELRSYPAAALEEAYRLWLRKNDRRPRLAHLIAGCAEYMQRIRAAIDIRARQELPPRDPNTCSCGCAGTRWALALVDATGQPRRYPADPKAIGVPSLDAASRNKLAGAVAALAGDFMTRDRIECLRTHNDLLPRDTGAFVGRDDRGVPVWLLNSAQEAAA